jgi:hypothetical protein
MANGHGGAGKGAGRPPGRKTRPPGPVAIDPKLIDPRAVLAAIAADPRASAMSKVRACEVLLRHSESGKSDLVVGASDRVTARAIAMLAQGRPN